MKKVVAELRTERIPDVDLALANIGVTGMTVAEESVAGRGMWTYPAENVRHVILTIVVNDGGVAKVVESIQRSATTGSWGDGKISVSRIECAYDISSGLPETGELETPLLEA